MPGRGGPKLLFDSRPPCPYNVPSLPGLTERCWSGRTGLPAKQLSGVNPDRGFESLPLRHRFLFLFDMLKAINPATGELIREVPEHDELEVERRLETAERAFGSWRRFS